LIALSRAMIKHNLQEERKKPPGSNPAAGGKEAGLIQGLME
jgi:hypothetical protein